MTAQTPESLLYDGQQMSMCSEPLADYFALGGVKPDFRCPSTGLWRGYVGTWEIVGGRLYLVGLRATLRDGGEASLATLFPGFPDRLFAHWFTGTIRVPEGEVLEYVHAGYESVFERDLFFEIEKGVVRSTRVRSNGAAESAEGPESHGDEAMAGLARRESGGEAGS